VTAAALAPDRRDLLRRRIRWIVAGTIAWNTVEAVVALTAGTVASSTALVAFGLGRASDPPASASTASTDT
jgi:hypothetical protein